MSDNSLKSVDPDTEELLANQALFPGDTGTLPLDVRRILIQLLIGPSLDAKRYPKLWSVLGQHEGLIRSRLSELFLELVRDNDMEVAFTRQADTGDLQTPVLLRRTNLTFIDTVLSLYLRQRFAESSAQGLRAVISGVEMREQLKLYEKNINTDHSGFQNRIDTAINNAKKRNFISRIPESEDRFEISPSLKLLFSAEEVINLNQYYRDLTADIEPDKVQAVGNIKE